MAQKTQVISRVVVKASVHRVPGKPTTKPRSRGPVGATRQIQELVVSTTEEEWNKRWAKALKVLKGEVSKPTTKPAPKPPEAKPVEKKAPAKKPAAKKPAAKPAPKK